MVPQDGNAPALEAVSEVFDLRPLFEWRGLGAIDHSGVRMRDAAREAGVAIVTGDTKVVHRGAADKLFTNTAGIGVVPEGIEIGADRAADRVIVNGTLGDQGAAIRQARGELALETELQSDYPALHGLVERTPSVCPGVRCLRNATRGGLATVLNELAGSFGVAIRIESLPVREERGVAVLGIHFGTSKSQNDCARRQPLGPARPASVALRRHHRELDARLCTAPANGLTACRMPTGGTTRLRFAVHGAQRVRGVCEILGLDPIHLANEGKLVAVVPREAADALLEAMRDNPRAARAPSLARSHRARPAGC